MTDDELKALTDAELRNAIGVSGGKLAEQRRKAEIYYLGEAKDDLAPSDIPGRSSVVSTDVRNTIESMLPQLMVKFTGGDTVVEFEPTLPDDEQKAQNCTDYLNYLFFKKNNGHAITYTWFKDALMQKRGFLKVWWDASEEQTREEYRGQTPVGLAMLMEDPELELTEQKAYPDEEDAKQRQKALEQLQQQLDHALNDPSPQAGAAVQQLQAQMQQIQAAPPAMLYDVTAKRTKKGGRVCVENVPPEEFIISREAKDIATARMVGHVFQRTISQLRAAGYKNVDSIGSGEDEFSSNMERVERLAWDDDFAGQSDESNLDESQRTVWVKELYLRVDYDGDGIAELRKVTRAGNVILDNEEADAAPFVSICPVPMPHKFFGLSVADLGFQTQKVNTFLLRSNLDNQSLEVNGRYFAVEGQVNLDDLLSSRPGGVVRMKQAGMAGRLDQGKGSLAENMDMLEYMKGFGEDAMGWSRNSQGTDPKAMGQTATATQILTNKADMRLDLIGRNFAEGFVELFRLMLKLVTQYQDKAAQIRLSGQWVDMDPREWRNQFDVSINVGLGVGNKDQQVQHLMALQNAQAHGMQIGIATPENLYESSRELAKNMGFKSPDKFFTKPKPGAQPPQPPNPMQIEQMKAQVKAQTDQAAKQAEMQLERDRMQMQAQVDQHRQEVEAQQQAAKVRAEMQLEREKFQLQMQLKQMEIQANAETQIAIARIKAESAIDAAQVSAQATLSTQQETASDNAVSND